MALRTKEKLLEHYSKAEISEFIQFDAFTDSKCFDSVVMPSKDGIAYMSTLTSELMYPVWSVRVFVKPGTEKEIAVKVLRGTADWIEKDFKDDCFDRRYIESEKKVLGKSLAVGFMTNRR
ncbi:hypothetical protein ES705_45591 [subsurface metagenome]